jgi:DNA-binding transcriptional LysR family regulator
MVGAAERRRPTEPRCEEDGRSLCDDLGARRVGEGVDEPTGCADASCLSRSADQRVRPGGDAPRGDRICESVQIGCEGGGVHDPMIETSDHKIKRLDMLKAISSANEMRDLEIRHLHALVAVAEARSFGRAADRLGYTQSAVSQQIAALERIVGEALFERPGGPRPVELTPAGAVLYDHAREILARIHAAGVDLANHRAGLTGRLRVGTYQSISVKILPLVIQRLRAERPDIEVHLFETDNQDRLLEDLGSGELDVSFVVLPVERDDVEVVALGADPFVLISPADADGAGGRIAPSELAGLPMIGQQMADTCQLRIERSVRDAGGELEIIFRTGDNSAVQAMVRAGMGHAVMPRLALDLDDPTIRVRELDPPLPPREIGIAWRSSRRLAPAGERFLGVVQQVCAEVLAA